MILASWGSITLGVFGVAAFVLVYYLVAIRLPKSKLYDRMCKRSWTKAYGQDVIQFFRELDAHVPGRERDEIPMFGRQLEDFAISLSDEERNELRETADAVIDSCRPVEYFELTRLTAYMGFLRSLSQSEEENTEKDAERFRKLCAIYDEMQKTKNQTED